MITLFNVELIETEGSKTEWLLLSSKRPATTLPSYVWLSTDCPSSGKEAALAEEKQAKSTNDSNALWVVMLTGGGQYIVFHVKSQNIGDNDWAGHKESLLCQFWVYLRKTNFIPRRTVRPRRSMSFILCPHTQRARKPFPATHVLCWQLLRFFVRLLSLKTNRLSWDHSQLFNVSAI